MQFHEVPTLYSKLKKDSPYNNPGDFYRYVLKRQQMWEQGRGDDMGIFQGISKEQILMEYLWYADKQPYYKIWDGVFDTFIKTRLDVEATLLKFPHRVFAIRLPKTDEGLITFKMPDGKDATIVSLLISGGNAGGDADSNFAIMNWSLYVIVDGEDFQIFSIYGRSILQKDGSTIEDNIFPSEDDLENNGLFPVAKNVIDACVRLVVATCFLATGSHKVLEYDVLTKHLNAYREEKNKNKAKRKDYEVKAKKKGKYGWNIGGGMRGRSLKLPNGVDFETACKNAGGRELLYQHVRGGHWHTVRYGEGRQKIKVVWFEPTTVRGDLPPAPME
jgi:hypothetical protein